MSAVADTAAFFDLDRTLIDVNSGTIWAKHEWAEKNISSLQFGQALLWIGMYHFSLIDMEAALSKALGFYRNTTAKELEARTRGWFVSQIEQRLRPEAKIAVGNHREQGHRLVMATSTSCFQAKIATERFGLDECIANEYEVDEDGRFTGKTIGDICYGEGKKEKALRWAIRNDIDMAASFFYSDSYSDLPLLQAVGHPKVVCPDPRLRRYATQHGWPIFDWQ